MGLGVQSRLRAQGLLPSVPKLPLGLAGLCHFPALGDEFLPPPRGELRIRNEKEELRIIPAGPG